MSVRTPNIAIKLFQTSLRDNVSIENRRLNYVNKDNFIISKKFSLVNSAKIDALLHAGHLIFSPKGNLWDSSTETVLSEFGYNNLYPNTISETFETQWIPIVYSKYSLYTDIKDPSYFVSLPSVIDKTMGGWLLYKESSPPQYYILYNPINRLDLNSSDNPIALYQQYCNVIKYQDSGCFCQDYTNPPQKNLKDPSSPLTGRYCTYNALQGIVYGQLVQDVLENPDGTSIVSGDKTANSQAWGNLTQQCGCMGDLCKEFKNNLIQFKPEYLPANAPFNITTCPAIQNIALTVCSANISEKNSGTIVNKGPITVSQDCATTLTTKTSVVSIKTNKKPGLKQNNIIAGLVSNYKYIIAGLVSIVLLVLIYKLVL